MAPLTTRLEEATQQAAAFGLANAAHHVGHTKAARPLKNPGIMLYAAAFRVVGAENHPPDPKQPGRGGAHRAGFERDPKIAICKPGPTEGCGCGAQSQQFGMRGGIVLFLHTVASQREHRAIRPYDHSAHRNLAARRGRPCLVNGQNHKILGKPCCGL